MIAIQFQKRDFEYDVYNLVKSFYPEEEIVLSDDDNPAAVIMSRQTCATSNRQNLNWQM